ncbi:MAG: C-terminal binding protein [Tissierellia bacterium]|jgi:D-3-phosphoglycerate dehydrogenase|nr:C-terminal binding protein [Bacillota bacterium]NLL23497.1 C-terminal binding protein [Tissierellia bacterium]
MAKKVLFGGVPGMVASDIEKMRQYVLEEAPDAEFHFYGEEVLGKEELLETAQGAKVLISWDQEMDEETYEKLDLIAYCAASVGFNAANIKAATKKGVYVINVPDYCTDEVAAHTVTLMLCLYRRFYLMVDYIREGNWDLAPTKGIRKFENSVVGLVGFGRIPQAVARKLAGFGVKIVAYDPFIDAQKMKELGAEKVELEELLKMSDYISLHSPLLESTKQMINREAIALMKDGVYIVNTARGALIDEEALYEALQNGKIQGVGLDVLADEPPTEMGRKIIALKNAIVTGHSSYVSLEASDEQIRSTAKNVAAFLSGNIPENTLNRKEILGGIDGQG